MGPNSSESESDEIIKMHYISRFWFRTTVLLSVVFLLGLGFIAVEVYLMSNPFKGYTEDSKLVEIPRGTRLVGIADLLQREGIIRHRQAFLVALMMERKGTIIRAGEYNFDRPLSEFEVIHKLLRGEVHYRQVTIPEGSNIFEIADNLQTAGLCSSDDFLAAASHTELIKDLSPDAVSLEGYLFPDTYKFEKQTPAIEIAAKMVDRFRHFLTPDYLEAVSAQGFTLNQAVILASLIEKETAQSDERPLISAVFHNRLKMHQRLECDPTVIYAALMAHRYRGTIYQSDLQIDSPFNTYLRSGLPIGPIANPGRASLEAAVHPAAVNYLFFVSDNNGRHVFSRTLAEHLMAVRQYRRAVAEENSLNPAPPAEKQKPHPPRRKRKSR